MSLLLLFNQPVGGGPATYNEAFSAGISAADVVGAAAAYANPMGEAVSATGTFAATQVFASALGAGVSLAENYANTGTFNSALAAQLAIADQLIGGMGYYDAQTAQVTLADGATVRTILAASLGEAIASASSLGATHIQVSSLGETLLLNATVVGVRVGLTWPAPSDVLLGVQYGPTGTDFTGTLAGGAGATIYAPRMTVTTTVEQLYLTQKPKKQAQQVVEAPTQQSSTKSKNAYVRTSIPQLTVLTSPDEVWVRTNKETF